MADEFWADANWRTSPRGNNYVRADGKPITVFRRFGGWRWSIGRSAMAGGPIYSDEAYGTAKEARAAAWEALTESAPMERDADAQPPEPLPGDWVLEDGEPEAGAAT